MKTAGRVTSVCILVGTKKKRDRSLVNESAVREKKTAGQNSTYSGQGAQKWGLSLRKTTEREVGGKLGGGDASPGGQDWKSKKLAKGGAIRV